MSAWAELTDEMILLRVLLAGPSAGTHFMMQDIGCLASRSADCVLQLENCPQRCWPPDAARLLTYRGLSEHWL